LHKTRPTCFDELPAGESAHVDQASRGLIGGKPLPAAQAQRGAGIQLDGAR